MTAASFKTLYQQGEIKKKDIFSVPYPKLTVEAGFNLRVDGPELEEHIESIAQAVMDGADIPPLLVRVDASGNILIVDGHCRHAAIGRAIERGAPIENVDCLPYRGNDADRVARMITSSQGKALTPLETAIGYKRLAAFGWTPDAIAGKAGKTRQHVEQLLILAHANTDVHELVASGVVSSAGAIDSVRKHGENAGAFLRAKFDDAKAAGASKLTPKAMKPWTPPAKVVAPLVESIDSFVNSLPNDARMLLTQMENAENSGALPEGQQVSVSASALLSMLKQHGALSAERVKAADKAREKAAKAAQMEIENNATEGA